MTNITSKNRRTVTKLLGMGAVFTIPIATVASLLPGKLLAASLVDPSSAEAQALQYTDSSTNEQAACHSCTFYQGDQAEQGPCPLFPGKEVKASGWCLTFTPKA